MNKLKVLELFAGIGACSKALERLGIEHEIIDAVEIDKYAMNSFNVIHGTNFETQDITQWDKDIEVDLIMHGSPCQDFSLAGKQAGGDEGSGTRSSLMYETIRIVEKLKPKYVIWENVKNLLSKNHRHNFDAYLQTMENLGYTNYYEVLNAKDYGIPQNRERIFTVSIRKDIDKNNFSFPGKQKLNLRLKDILEEEVDEKYYLTDSMIKTYQRDFGSKGKEVNLDEPIPTLTASMGTGGGNIPILKQYGQLFGGKWDKINESCRRVYSEEGLSPTIHTCQGGNTEPKVATYSPYVNKKYEEFIEENGYVPEMFNPYNKSEITDVAPTLTAQGDSITKSGTVLKKENFKIRKLTPKECWRLMGFDDEDFEKAEKVNSNTQLYKQARKFNLCTCT